MFRFLIYTLIAVFLITLVRAFLGIIMKGFSELVSPSQPDSAKPGAPVGGELKKDPVCGTYVPAQTSVKLNVKGEVYHFCSEDCMNKFSRGGK
jgi:YHS domain-containing protein